ncbi:MAG: Macrolide export ATP-binding/permease protein MacB [Firmicutes bacterium]|nr:Macrolide export ATP-binding/permease protein MacB [Bacillota bacterium]MBT9157139.1 Macrolide export ATP-binding/permease protein MacB [Bacillota bacterium]
MFKYLQVALKNLLRRRFRTFLTVLGIAIGISMLFSFMAFSKGYEASMRQELNRLGAHMLAIAKGCPYEATALIMHGGVIEDYLNVEDVARIREMPNVQNAVGMFMNLLVIPHGKNIVIFGMNEESFAMRPWWTVRGTMFVDANSVILPEVMATAMGLDIGGIYRLPGVEREFVISGLLEKTGTQDDQFIYLPLLTAQEIFNAAGKVTSIAIQLEDLSLVQQVVDSVESLPDVQAITMSQVLATAQTLMSSAQAMINSIVVIAVVISALGVMNSILMSVFERTREIGMMKAVGASQSDIISLVWIESVLLSLSGGVLGILASLGGGRLIEPLIRGVIPFAPLGDLLVFDLEMVFISLFSALLLGLVAGAYPAIRASQLSPMEAIRSE